MERVRLAWQKRCATMPASVTKSTAWSDLRLLDDLVRKEFTADEILRLAEGTRVVDEAGVPEKLLSQVSGWEGKRYFDIVFAYILIDMCGEAGHRDALVRVLARRPVSYIDFCPIEFELAASGEKGHIERGVLVLADAYAQAESQAAKRSALEALRRTFGPFGVSGKNDDEFVRNCADWYTRNESRLAVNEWYNTGHSHVAKEDQLYILKDQQPTTAVGQ